MEVKLKKLVLEELDILVDMFCRRRKIWWRDSGSAGGEVVFNVQDCPEAFNCKLARAIAVMFRGRIEEKRGRFIISILSVCTTV